MSPASAKVAQGEPVRHARAVLRRTRLPPADQRQPSRGRLHRRGRQRRRRHRGQAVGSRQRHPRLTPALAPQRTRRQLHRHRRAQHGPRGLPKPPFQIGRLFRSRSEAEPNNQRAAAVTHPGAERVNLSRRSRRRGARRRRGPRSGRNLARSGRLGDGALRIGVRVADVRASINDSTVASKERQTAGWGWAAGR